MPECQNCGSFVTKQYVKVFAPDDVEAENTVRACPYCATVREGADIRTARGRGASYQSGELE